MKFTKYMFNSFDSKLICKYSSSLLYRDIHR